VEKQKSFLKVFYF